jgi:hypothetical protein
MASICSLQTCREGTTLSRMYQDMGFVHHVQYLPCTALKAVSAMLLIRHSAGRCRQMAEKTQWVPAASCKHALTYCALGYLGWCCHVPPKQMSWCCWWSSVGMRSHGAAECWLLPGTSQLSSISSSRDHWHVVTWDANSIYITQKLSDVA